MGSANGDRSASRRKKRRGGQPLTPAEAGDMLREARAGPRDRARRGSRPHGHLVEEPRGTRVRRGTAVLGSLGRRSRDAPLRGARLARPRPAGEVGHLTGPGARGRIWVPAPTPPGRPPLPTPRRRPPGTCAVTTATIPILLSFTQTAQVPAVGGWTSGPATGAFHPGGPSTGNYKKRQAKAARPRGFCDS